MYQYILAPDLKCTKRIKGSIDNNRNGCTRTSRTSNSTFEM